jgi:hypothetical protein
MSGFKLSADVSRSIAMLESDLRGEYSSGRTPSMGGPNGGATAMPVPRSPLGSSRWATWPTTSKR